MPKLANKSLGRHSRPLVALLLCGAYVVVAGAAPPTSAIPLPAPPDAVAAPTPPSLAPRVEIVATREGDDWVFYVDDYASNRAIEGLQLDVNLGNRRLRARATADGRYRLPTNLLEVPPSATVLVSVQGPGLDASLPVDLPAEAPPALDEAGRSREKLLAALVILSLMALLVFSVTGLRRRNRWRPSSARIP